MVALNQLKEVSFVLIVYNVITFLSVKNVIEKINLTSTSSKNKKFQLPTLLPKTIKNLLRKLICSVIHVAIVYLTLTKESLYAINVQRT